MVKPYRLARILWVGLLIFSSFACTWFTPRPDPESEQEPGLTVLAGSELKELESLLPEIQRATGVKMTFQYIGTLEGAERIAAGEPVDFAWFSHARYLHLLQGAAQRIHAQERIMLSPVILGVKSSKAKAWGWINQPNLTWQDVAKKAGSGELRYAMSNPSSSNSGFSALVGVTASLSGQMDALQAADITAAGEALQQFLKGQALSSRSSGWLSDKYVQKQDQLNGIINYESELLRLGKSGKLDEPLYLVYPKEGIITADYPLLLINPSQRAAYQKVVAYLRSAEVQQILMTDTLHRPVNPQVALSRVFPSQMLVELPAPGSMKVANQLLSAYLEKGSKPVHTYYVLDLSKPMKGARLDNLKKALYTLTGADASPADRFARFRDSEKVTIITFNDRVSARQDFEVRFSDPDSLRPLQEYVDGLRAGGDSALYSALSQAYQQATRDKAEAPGWVHSIVLMSYGQRDAGISEKAFLTGYRKLAGARNIRLYTLFFGKDEKELGTMQGISDHTGGRMRIAGQDSLSVLFNEIRGYE